MLVVVELLLGTRRAPSLALVGSRWVARSQVIRGLRGDLLVDAAPDCVDALLVVQALEYAVAADHEEIKVVLELETSDFGIANDNVLIATVPLPLGLDVAEGARHREATREGSQWPLDVEVFLAGCGGSLGEGLCAVDLAACGLDASALLVIIRLVISGQDRNLGARIERHQATAIANVDHVRRVVDDHHHSRAGAGPLWTHLLARHGVLGSLLGHLDEADEAALALFEASNDRLLRELGEVLILHDEIVQVVSEVVSAGSSAVTIKHSEEADLRPLDVRVLLALGLQDVQDDGHPVLVVVTNDALVRVRGVGLDRPTLLLRGLCWLVIFQE